MSELKSLTTLLTEVDQVVSKQIEGKIDEVVTELKKQVDDIKKYQPTVVINGTKKTEIKGLKHKQLNQLVTIAGLDHNVLMVGTAGSGKTKSAEQVSEALGLDFYCMSVGAQTTKSDLLGYMDANGKYVKTHFRDAFEKGGVFVMDEVDAGNSNVLIILNSALANGVMSFPDKMVKRHKDFKFIGTANTYGNGANRQYVGRNQLDSATLDRFTVIDWKIDTDLEGMLVANYHYGKVWHKTVQDLRQDVESKGLRAIISPRATVKGAELLEMGFDIVDVIEMTLLAQVPQDNRNDVLDFTKTMYKANKSDMKVADKKADPEPKTPAEIANDKLKNADSTAEQLFKF